MDMEEKILSMNLGHLSLSLFADSHRKIKKVLKLTLVLRQASEK